MPNSFQKAAYFSGSSLARFRQHVQCAPGQRAAHGLDFRILLQQLARDVQRQVAGIEHAFHEPQVQRQELLGVVHDEHAPYIQLEAACRIALAEVKRRLRRDIQQAGVFALALHRLWLQASGAPLSCVMWLIEVLVFLFGDFAARPGPQGLGLVHGLVVQRGGALPGHPHRKGQVVGVAAHQRAQPPGIGEFLGIVLEMQGHAWCRAVRWVTVSTRKSAIRVRLPAHAARRGAGLAGATSTRSATMKAE